MGAIQEQDKLTAYLLSMTLYPFVYLFIQQSAETIPTQGRLHRNLKDFPEGRALSLLEKWCRTDAYASKFEELYEKYRDFIISYMRQSGFVWILGSASVRTVMPNETMEEVVSEQLEYIASAPDNAFGRASDSFDPPARFISDQLRRTYALPRSHTWHESTNFLFTAVTLWLGVVSFFFQLLSAWLRVVSSLFALIAQAATFLVPLSVVMSILSAVFAILSGAAGFVSVGILSVRSFVGWNRPRIANAVAKAEAGGAAPCPHKLYIRNMDELDTVLAAQLKQAAIVKNRPDVPQLQHDPLLVQCYDLGIIDAKGRPLVHSTRELLSLAPFNSNGFFKYAGLGAKQVAAVLLMRSLALKHINIVMRDSDIRFAMVLGSDEGGKAALFDRLTFGSSSSADAYQPAAANVGLLVGSKQLYVVNITGLASKDAQQRRLATQIADLSQGVFSCAIYVVSGRSAPSDEALHCIASCLAVQRPCLVCLDVSTQQQRPQHHISPAGSLQDQMGLGVQWGEAVDLAPSSSGVEAADGLKEQWQCAVLAVCERHGLDAGLCTMTLMDPHRQQADGAAAGPEQVRDWVTNYAVPRQVV